VNPRLFAWQEDAAGWLAPKDGAILGLAPGLGKTATAISAAEERASRGYGGLKVLVVAPLSLLETWRKEILRWSEILTRVVVFHKGEVRSRQTKQGRVLPGGNGMHWVVTNYDTMVRNVDKVRGFDLVICDESVLLKNRKAKRTKAMGVIRRRCGRGCWLLSGSPTTKYLDDMWAQFNIIRPDLFRSYWRFAKTYCEVHQDQWGWKIVEDQPGAYGRLKRELSPFFYARSQSDVTDLPDWIQETIEVPMEKAQARAYLQMEEEALLDLPDGDELVAPNALAKMTRLLQIASSPGLVGVAGRAAKWEALEEVLEYAPGPTIVWTSYIRTADSLSLKYGAPSLTGATPVDERERIVERFQAGEVPVLFAHPGVGKFGLTLTRGRSAVYLERSFDGDAYVQSMYRIRRIGTVEPPLVYRLLAALPPDMAETTETIDHVVDGVLHRKSSGAGRLVAVRASDFDILRRRK
jgi:SNF2 family DNA or RNA helicase